eukprot:gene10328-biopygen11520
MVDHFSETNDQSPGDKWNISRRGIHNLPEIKGAYSGEKRTTIPRRLIDNSPRDCLTFPVGQREQTLHPCYASSLLWGDHPVLLRLRRVLTPHIALRLRQHPTKGMWWMGRGGTILAVGTPTSRWFVGTQQPRNLANAASLRTCVNTAQLQRRIVVATPHRRGGVTTRRRRRAAANAGGSDAAQFHLLVAAAELEGGVDLRLEALDELRPHAAQRARLPRPRHPVRTGSEDRHALLAHHQTSIGFLAGLRVAAPETEPPAPLPLPEALGRAPDRAGPGSLGALGGACVVAALASAVPIEWNQNPAPFRRRRRGLIDPRPRIGRGVIIFPGSPVHGHGGVLLFSGPPVHDHGDGAAGREVFTDAAADALRYRVLVVVRRIAGARHFTALDPLRARSYS